MDELVKRRRPKLLIVSGETSGDFYAASLIDVLLKYDNFDNEISSYFDTLYSNGCLKKALITFEDFEKIKSGILSQKKYIKMMNI